MSSANKTAADIDLLSEDHPPAAIIFGVEGLVLTQAEKDIFKKTNPLGFILFARNCDNPQQVRDLCESFHQTVGRQYQTPRCMP